MFCLVIRKLVHEDESIYKPIEMSKFLNKPQTTSYKNDSKKQPNNYPMSVFNEQKKPTQQPTQHDVNIQLRPFSYFEPCVPTNKNNAKTQIHPIL